MSIHSQSTPARSDSTDSPSPADATSDATPASDRGPATFSPGCHRRLVNLMDEYNAAMPEMDRDRD